MYGNSALFVRPVVSNIRCYKNSTKKLLEFLADMPKANSARIVEAHRQRQQISKKSEMYGPSTVYLQVLGSGAMGASNTLYLFTDHKRYLFNCGEGIQRLAHEHKVKLSRVDHIFITSKTWRNIGGLPGLSLTLQDVGVPNITLHGPEGLDELYNATRRFVTMKDMHVTMAKCSPNEDFEDNVMSVKYVLLGPHDDLLVKDPKPAAKKLKLDTTIEKEFEEFIHDDTDYYKSEKQNVDNNKKHNKDKPKQKINIDKDPLKKKTEKVLHELQKKTHCSVAYICTLKKRLGTLSLEKCVEHGVKPGPLLGQLKNGHDVVLPDGTLVLAKDVKTPDDPGPVFIVLDVPELSYLKEGEFSAHFDNGTNPPENIPTLIVHYTPPQVFNHPTYRSFLMMFGPTTRHLIVNSQNSCLGSEAVHRTQHKLHLLDPDIFPLLRDASIQAVWNVHPPVPKTNSPVRLKGLEELKNKIALAQFQNIINIGGSAKGDCIHTTSQGLEDAESSMKLELIAGRTLTMFHLRPKKQLDRSAEPKLHVQDYIQETMDVDGFVGSLEQFRRLVDSMRYAKSDSCEYPKVVFLGTGSCIPSKTRNTSAIVLQINENCSMLLDCGEGTFCQLVRFYGPKRVNPFLRTLKAIYVSHLHADHHIGLIGLLQARRMAFHESSSTNVSYDPVYLLAPGQIVTWLSTYDQQFERIRGDFTLIPNQSLIEDPSSMEHTDMTSAVLASIGVQDIRTCLVSHCPNAFGVAITIDEMQKITYSGDTIPCDELVNIGKNSTLLIHEATMEDELADEARIKMHSTTSQAIEVGRRMNARYTLLTHFSQRYARLPRLNAHILNDNNSVGIAFDNMQITMSDLELLPHMYAPLQLMFAEHCVEMELKAAQRAKQKERRLSSPNMPSADATSHQTKGTKSDSRKRLPASCQYSSVPATVPRAHAKYRESNASRLRQEMRGMTVTGIVRRSIRSKSSSPAKVSTQCYGSTRSSSETFSLNKKAQERHHSAVCIVDSRSKTINTASRSSDVDSAPDQNKKRQTNVYSALTDANSNGYGKPLVTPMNKKLFIRRDVPRNLCRPVNSEKVSPIVSRTRSPIRSWKAENRESSPQVTATQRNISNKPTKGTIPGNKFRGSNTSTNIKPKPESKIPVKKESTLTKPLRPSSSPLCRRSKSPAWQSSSLDSNAPDTKSNISNIRKQNLYQRDVKSWSPDSNGSSTRRLERKLSLKNKSDKLNNKPVLPAGIHRNTSFKPELEDIKSSYLLLNKKVNQHNMKARLNNEKNLILPSVSKPKPVNETNRQQQLMEAKKKYQSKQFWNDARYDKIEGLNWISWK